MNLLLTKSGNARCDEKNFLCFFWVNGYVEVRTLYIQAEHAVLRSDDGLEHAKILVGRLALDRCLVENAEGMHDALLALARKRRRVNPLERKCWPPGARS